MIGTAALAVLLATSSPVAREEAGEGAREYWPVVELYQRGEREGAERRLAELSPPTVAREILRVADLKGEAAGCARCEARRHLQQLPLLAAVMLHTDFAWRGDAPVANISHLRVAAIVLEAARAVSPSAEGFARRWYLAVTLKAFEKTDGTLALRSGQDGLQLFPGDPDLLLAVGSLQEALATSSPGGPVSQRGARVTKPRLHEAESLLAAAAETHPEPAEALLRLGRVQALLGQRQAATTLARVVDTTTDVRLAHLARLFLGSLDEAAGRFAAAAGHYREAVSLLPEGQAARVALSHAQRRRGDPRAARQTLEAALAWPPRGRTADPYWAYPWGQCARAERLLDELRSATR